MNYDCYVDVHTTRSIYQTELRLVGKSSDSETIMEQRMFWFRKL